MSYRFAPDSITVDTGRDSRANGIYSLSSPDHYHHQTADYSIYKDPIDKNWKLVRCANRTTLYISASKARSLTSCSWIEIRSDRSAQIRISELVPVQTKNASSASHQKHAPTLQPRALTKLTGTDFLDHGSPKSISKQNSVVTSASRYTPRSAPPSGVSTSIYASRSSRSATPTAMPKFGVHAAAAHPPGPEQRSHRSESAHARPGTV